MHFTVHTSFFSWNTVHVSWDINQARSKFDTSPMSFSQQKASLIHEPLLYFFAVVLPFNIHDAIPLFMKLTQEGLKCILLLLLLFYFELLASGYCCYCCLYDSSIFNLASGCMGIVQLMLFTIFPWFWVHAYKLSICQTDWLKWNNWAL